MQTLMESLFKYKETGSAKFVTYSAFITSLMIGSPRTFYAVMFTNDVRCLTLEQLHDEWVNISVLYMVEDADSYRTFYPV